MFESSAFGVFLSTNYDLSDDVVLTVAARWDRLDIDTRYVD